MEEVIPNGSKIVIKDTGLKGTVLSVCMFGINNPSIEYRIIYWKAGERQDVWLFDWEIELYIDNSKKAGFKNYEKETSKLIE